MIKAFIYDGVRYGSELELRKALFEGKRLKLGRTPADNVAEFWAKHGVEYREEEEPIETLRKAKLLYIKQAFLGWRNGSATLFSSLGFRADSNERANTDVSGLLVSYADRQEEQITFRDADNVFHELSYAQLKALQKEIVENGSYAYAQKWAYDSAVESATSRAELDAIVVRFEGRDFRKE